MLWDWFCKSPPPLRPQTRLSEAAVLAIAGATPLGAGATGLAVHGVTQTDRGLEWQVGEFAIGATRWFRIDDATGTILDSGRHKAR